MMPYDRHLTDVKGYPKTLDFDVWSKAPVRRSWDENVLISGCASVFVQS